MIIPNKCNICQEIDSLYTVLNERADASFGYFVHCNSCKTWVGKIDYYGDFHPIFMNKSIEEDILNKNGKKYMINWDLNKFKSTHPTLFRVIIESMKMNLKINK